MPPGSHAPVARTPLLREVWRPLFGDAFWLGIGLAALAIATRALGMLGPPRLFWVLPVGFVVLALTPYVFFRTEGRRRAGLRRPRSLQWIVWGVLLGGLAAWICFRLGDALYGETRDNWFVSVRRSFPVTPGMEDASTTQLFWVITIPAMIFSPLGEEIFFRGFLQQAAEERWSHRAGVILDAGLFAVVHLFHHGIVRIDDQVRILPASGVLWMVLIFFTGVLFALLRQRTGSLVAPILSHAAFNLVMNITIFYAM